MGRNVHAAITLIRQRLSRRIITRCLPPPSPSLTMPIHAMNFPHGHVLLPDDWRLCDFCVFIRKNSELRAKVSGTLNHQTNKEVIVTSKKGTSAKQALPETHAAGEESVDKIRDILFGSQMRDYERKFSQLEERIMKEVSRLREEQEKRLTSLEQSIDRELDSLLKRLDGEHDDRLAAEQDLAGALVSHAEQLRSELAGLDEGLKQTAGALQRQIEQQSRTLNEEIGARQAESGERLARETGDLREQKVDRSALSTLLNELAARIAGSSPLPADGSSPAGGSPQEGGGKT